MEKLSARIKRLREDARLTQSQLASRVDVSRVAVTKWESGQTENLKLANLVALCKVFSKTADEMLSGELSGHAATVVCAQEASEIQNAYSDAIRKRAIPQDLQAAYLELTDQGQELVRTQLHVAIETARRMHGTRPGSSQTAA